MTLRLPRDFWGLELWNCGTLLRVGRSSPKVFPSLAGLESQVARSPYCATRSWPPRLGSPCPGVCVLWKPSWHHLPVEQRLRGGWGLLPAKGGVALALRGWQGPNLFCRNQGCAVGLSLWEPGSVQPPCPGDLEKQEAPPPWYSSPDTCVGGDSQTQVVEGAQGSWTDVFTA